MELPLSSAVVDRLEILDHAASTNDELVARSAERSDFSVLVTNDQRAGRGRLGREWTAPRGTALATSILLRPSLPAGEPLGLEHFSWLPLLAGVAMARAVTTVIPDGAGTVGVKWPNDVQIGGLKVAGVLGELLPLGDGVVLGVGLNIGMTREQLPVPTATSLLLAGAHEDGLVDAVLHRYLLTLKQLYTDFVRLGADAEASGAFEQFVDVCVTLGQQVRVHLPGGDSLVGIATGIDKQGRLIVRTSSDGNSLAVAAGDVVHVRYE